MERLRRCLVDKFCKGIVARRCFGKELMRVVVIKVAYGDEFGIVSLSGIKQFTPHFAALATRDKNDVAVFIGERSDAVAEVAVGIVHIFKAKPLATIQDNDTRVSVAKTSVGLYSSLAVLISKDFFALEVEIAYCGLKHLGFAVCGGGADCNDIPHSFALR